MGHYAKIEKIDNPYRNYEDGEQHIEVVTQVIVANAQFIESIAGTTDPNLQGEWIKTSYNTKGGVHYEPNPNPSTNAAVPSQTQEKALRMNYGSIGMFYDRKNDAFYAPRPYPSWTLDKATFTWHAPNTKPDVADSPSGAGWVWSESAYQANNQAGWMDYQEYIQTYSVSDVHVEFDPENFDAPKDYSGFSYSF